MSERPHQREPKPWRNIVQRPPLPEPSADHWQWLPGEVCYGADVPTARRLAVAAG
jgi:hypothetical protein